MDEAWWVQHVFGRSLADKTNPEAAQVAAELRPCDAIEFVTRVFTNCGAILSPFRDEQVAEGMVFLAKSGESDWMYYLDDPTIDWEARQRCIQSIELVFRDCFAKRCENAMHTRASGSKALRDVCFMWWDGFPSGGTVEVDEELIDVMGRILQIEHAACQESALHGLGHWAVANEDRVRGIVDEWLGMHPELMAELRAYAEAARDGNVQ